MKIVIVGAGGVGGYFGGRLAATGADVTFVARGAHLTAMRKNGLRITSPKGETHVSSVNAVERVIDIDKADLVIVSVKLWDTEAVAASLKPLANKGAAVISFQNGVQKDDVLRKFLPAGSVLGGLCYIAASITEPGVIGHTGTMQKLVFGEYGKETSARCEAFLNACQKAEIDAEISASIERLIWEKFVFLVGLSGTTSLYRTTIGPIRDDPDKRTFLFNTMREVVSVGRKKAVALSEDFAEDRLTFCDTLPPGMPSSMKIDLERGNRLELPWLSGAVVDLGKQLGVATPTNDFIVRELTPYINGKH